MTIIALSIIVFIQSVDSDVTPHETATGDIAAILE